MNNPQILGIILAIATAIGCVLYEKLTKQFSCSMVIFLCSFDFLIWSLVSMTIKKEHNVFLNDFKNLFNTPILWGLVFLYLLTGITSYCWYNITKTQSVMVSSMYEIKYIAALTLFYILFGTQKISINTGIGLVCAAVSLYFISKS